MTRQEEKEKTRNRILRSALAEFNRYGYRGANTARIAQKADVAHGTIFLHFHSKDQLLYEIIHQRIVKISNRLYAAARDSESIESLCRIHLQYVNEELAFESMLARELPFMPARLKRQVLTIRCGIINHFYEVLSKSIANGSTRPVNITMALSFWFGTISYFLANQEMFARKGKIIQEKGEDLVQFFINVLRR